MSTKTAKGRLLSLSSGKLDYFSRSRTAEARKRECSEPIKAGEPSLHPIRHLLTRQGAALASLQVLNESLPGLNQPGLFSHSTSPIFLSAENERRTLVQKERNDEFHDSNSGVDIFALYNACNGIIRHGFLDVSELDKYSPADAEALDVPRLKKIWEHTLTGCSQCRGIIEALHGVREEVRDVADSAEPND